MDSNILYHKQFLLTFIEVLQSWRVKVSLTSNLMEVKIPQ